MYNSHKLRYSIIMKRPINQNKNQLNVKKRGISVEEIFEKGELLDVIDHPKRNDQQYEIYNFNEYAWVVVISKDDNRYVTHFKSRQAKKRYGI
jgi:uncharacterized DUF497 family protein